MAHPHLAVRMPTTRSAPVGPDALAPLRELRDRDPQLFAVAVGNAVLFAAFSAGVALDPATVPASSGGGVEPRWLKPAKFAGSIAAFAATLGWLGVYLPVAGRRRRQVSWVVAVGSVIEIALIAGQAARGVESHFNTSSAVDGAIYGVMGLTIVAITAAVGWLALRTLRGDMRTAAPFAAGIRFGLVLFVVGAVEGGAMSGLATDTVVRGPHLPLLGWTPAGDFRVAHFVGLHGWQVLPAVGYVTARLERRGRVTDGRRVVRTVAAAYAGLFTAALALAVAPLV